MSYFRILITLAFGACLALPVAAKEPPRGEGQEERRTQVMRIAEGAPNRIITPYDSANLVTNVEHEAWSVGGVLYLLPMSGEHTIAGFIQDDSGRWAVPVMFEVARIPPQEIRLDDPNYHPVADGERPTQKKGHNRHVDPIVDALVEAINEGSVRGFRQMPQAAGQVVYVGPMRMEIEHAQQRGTLRIERHKITHEGFETRELSEASFEVPGRLGVTVFPPMTAMEPGEQAHVFIARRVQGE